MMCPVCGKFEFTALQETDLLFRDEMQCSVCGWKYDQRQHEDHDLKNGLNELSLGRSTKERLCDSRLQEF